MTLKGAEMRQSRVMFSLCLGLLLYPAIRLCSSAAFTCGTSDVACLIASITAANRTPEPDTIRLAAGIYMLTAMDNNTDGPNGLPPITSALTIAGVGAGQTTVARASSAPIFRLFHVAASGTLTLQGLILQGGGGGAIRGGAIANVQGVVNLIQTTIRDSGAHEGGGLHNDGGTVILTQSFILNNGAGGSGGGLWNGQDMASNMGTMYITDTTIADNGVNGWGGGLANHGTVIIANSTIADNFSPTVGGAGMWNFGTLTLMNSTVAHNDARGDFGGGIQSDGGSVLLRNSIVADNQSNVVPPYVSPNCTGVITSEGHNLIGDPTGCTIALQPSDLTGDPGLNAYLDDGQPRAMGIIHCSPRAVRSMPATPLPAPPPIGWDTHDQAHAISGRSSSSPCCPRLSPSP
jgi:hypothetical protein